MDGPSVRAVIAKTGNQRDQYLPLWMHLRDTEQMMIRLLTAWLPDAARSTLAGEMNDVELMRLARFLAMTHDLGKATPGFQDKVALLVEGGRERLADCGLQWGALPNARESPHALAGEVLLLEAGCSPSVASIIGAHHGKPSSEQMHSEPGQLCLHPENYFGKAREAWKAVQQSVIADALTSAGYNDLSELPHISVPVQLLLSGLLVMADWLASNPAYFPLFRVDEPCISDPQRRGEVAWRRIDLPECWQPEVLFGSEGLCERRFFSDAGVGYTPNAVQQAVMRTIEEAENPGIIILEAQMGVGKTEAALLGAELLSCGMNGQPRRGGIFFGLPTQATANGIFPRVRRWADTLTENSRATIRLAHGGAEMNEEYASLREHSNVEEDAADDSGLVVHEWLQGRKQALLSSFVIGTVDQLLMSALRQKHVMLRHLGLCGKVVIVDEVHAYDAYMSQYLNMALTWLGAFHVPVILLSATLPPRRRCELITAYLGVRRLKEDAPWQHSLDYPQLTWTDGTRVCQRKIEDHTAPRQVTIEREDFDADDERALAAYLSEKLAQGGCAGVIVNTVRRAQAIAAALEGALEQTEVLLLHAQFVMPDRIEHENELLRRVGKQSGPAERNRLVVVGTQVMEQSLDIDVDLLVTDLCPMDLLLQRIGRLHRHAAHDAIRPRELRQARCLVLGAGETLEKGGLSVYGEYLLMRTCGFLPSSVTLPADIPLLVRQVYDESVPLPVEPEGYAKARDEHEREERQKRSRANGFRLNKPEECPDFPWMETMTGLMDCDYRGDDQRAQAAVRDGDPSIDMLLLQLGDGRIMLTDEKSDLRLPLDHEPDQETCRLIARQRIRLPRVLCAPWQTAERTIDEVKRQNAIFAEWQQSPWLRGELILLLDADGTTCLNGWRLSYNQRTGLLCTKEETHESNGV